MLWEKRKVNAYKHYKKLCLGAPLSERCPCNSGEPESHSSKDREDRSYRQHIVEVGDYIICVVQGNIQRAVS